MCGVNGVPVSLSAPTRAIPAFDWGAIAVLQPIPEALKTSAVQYLIIAKILNHKIPYRNMQHKWSNISPIIISSN